MTRAGLRVDRAAVLAFRARAMHLDERRPVGDAARAAWGGLQDSAPRSALLSLHARLAGAGPDTWEVPGLTQVWGPRLAAYVVPEDGVAAFTVGRLPRDEAARRTLERRARAIVAACGGERAVRAREVTERIAAATDVDVRPPAATGRYRIRWDARMTWIVPAPVPARGEEGRASARHELARRYLGWLGPGTPDRFAWWAGVAPADARATWAALARELVAVDGPAGPGHVLARDADALAGAAADPVAGVRLLPTDDPWLVVDRELLVADRRRRATLWAPPDARPALADGSRFTPGAVVVDGEVAGIWGRRQRRVTLVPWGRWPARVLAAVVAEAEGFAGPLGGRVTVDVHGGGAAG